MVDSFFFRTRKKQGASKRIAGKVTAVLYLQAKD